MTRVLATSRSDIVSSFTAIKGALIEETYAALVTWDFGRTKKDNLNAIKRENLVTAKSETWLRDVVFVLSRRLDPGRRDRPLALLAKAGMRLESWQPLLLWHMTRDEFLFRDFLVRWLFPAWESGTFRVRPDDLEEYLRRLPDRGGQTEHSWSKSTLKRVSAGLLGMSVDFGLMKGSAVKEFSSYQLPDDSFLYLLHAMLEGVGNPSALVESEDWRLFLMRRSDVERELLRLHQYRRLEYHAAGSLIELTLPCRSALEYAERWTA